MIHVVLRGAPVALLLELQETVDGLQREVQLTSLVDGVESVEAALVEGLVERRDDLVTARATVHAQVGEARSAQREVVDLEVDLPDDAAGLVAAIGAAVSRADEAAAAGALLTPGLRPAVRHLHEWIVAEVVGQAQGSAPRAFVAEGPDVP